MLFKSIAVTALASAASASPLFRRQAVDNGTATAPAANTSTPAGNSTAPATNSTSNSTSSQTGSSYLNATVVSVPLGVNASGWSTNFTNATEPYAGASQLLGNPTRNGTNTTLAWKGQPAGGVIAIKPNYTVQSNFDFQSLNLALNQEFIELDLFNFALANFSVAEFEAAGIDASSRYLIQKMAEQEIGHARIITSMLGGDRAAKQCIYQYPFKTVKEFIVFTQLLTRWGEAGVYGFLPSLNSRPSAQLVLQSITVEARQQMIFRQMQGLPAMPEWFETGLPQSYAWTLLSPYIRSCPPNNPLIEWTRFPLLNVTNQPYALDGTPGINSNYTLNDPMANRTLQLEWEPLNKTVGYDNLYKTASVAKAPKFLAFISQLNVTYAPLYNITKSSASVDVPNNATVFPGEPLLVNTVFISLVDQDVYLTPANLSLINNHTVAVGHYQAS